MGITPVSLSKIAISSFSAAANGMKTAARTEAAPSINLIRFFKKGLHNYEQIEGIISHIPEEKKSLGMMPAMWRRKFSSSELSQKTREIHSIFYDFAREFQETDGSSVSDKTLKKLAKTLGTFLKTKTEVSYVDAGMFGSVLRIQGGEEDLALKVFHNVLEKTEPSAISAYKRHGQTMEIQNAIALTHGLKPSQRAKFHMGRVTSLGENGGYMLSEFVSLPKAYAAKIPPYTAREDFTYSRFIFKDCLTAKNIINGKIVDFGDVVYRFPNKKQEAIAKEIFPLICKGDTEKLAALKKQYKDNPDFKAVVTNSSSELVRYLSYPFNLCSFVKAEGAKEVLSSMSVLGVDFPELRTYKHFSPKEINFLKSVGIL